MTNLPVLAQAQTLVVRQQVSIVEVYTGLETKNRYVVQQPNGELVFYVAEQSTGAKGFLSRAVVKQHRWFTMRLLDADGNVELELERSATWLYSKLDVRDGQGQGLGTIVEHFTFFTRRLSVQDASGRELAEIRGSFLSWKLRVMQGDQEVGRITKQSGGVLKDTFTKASTFDLQLGPRMDPQLRTLVLAATFLIDFLYFER